MFLEVIRRRKRQRQKQLSASLYQHYQRLESLEANLRYFSEEKKKKRIKIEISVYSIIDYGQAGART